MIMSTEVKAIISILFVIKPQQQFTVQITSFDNGFWVYIHF